MKNNLLIIISLFISLFPLTSHASQATSHHIGEVHFELPETWEIKQPKQGFTCAVFRVYASIGLLVGRSSANRHAESQTNKNKHMFDFEGHHYLLASSV